MASKSLSTEQLISTLKARSDVRHAEPNYRVHALSVTDDPFSDSQWSMQSSAAAPGVSHQWEATGVTGSDKVVAVVDTGVDYTHPDLQDNMWVNTHYPALRGVYGADFAYGDVDPMDDNGHGTHCAGIIGAVGNNGIGISGVNQSIKIMALKVMDAEGKCYTDAVIAAYEYIDRALDLGEPVVAVNLSLGGNEYGWEDAIMAELVDVVGEKGAVTVAAAGNASSDNDALPIYPANLESPYVISVAATREDGALAGFSNYGEQTVDIAAPGANILSTVSYSSYNPSIYGDKQDDYSARFDNFEGEAGRQRIASEFAANVYVNGEKTSLTFSDGAYRSDDGKVVISQSERAFVPQGTAATGSSLQIEASNLEKGDLVCLPVPYQVGETARSAPHVSDQVYDGKEKRPAVKVELAGKELTPGEDYSVEYRDNTNVGTATVVVTGVSTGAGAGGYTGTATGTFRIVKAQNPLSPKGKTVKASYSKLKSKPQAVKRASAIDLGKAGAEGAVTYSKLWGDGLISVDKKTGNLTLAKGLKPYTYEVGVLICAAGNGNYSPAKEYVNVTVKVSKAENTLSATGKKATVSAAKLKKASVNVSRSSAIKVSNAKCALSYAKVSGNKKIAVDAKTGKLTVAKGLKKGSCKVKVKVTAKGNSYYKSVQKTVTATVRVK